MNATPETETSALVLLVDDDIALRLLAREALEQSGFRVEEAGNGVEALSAFGCVRPDIVLLDVLMPGLDGYSVCTELRRQGSHTPIVMVTGSDDTESILRAYEVGATDFLPKPIHWGLLGHRVRYVLRSSRAMEELRRSEGKNRALLEAIPDLIVQVSSEGELREFKPGKDLELTDATPAAPRSLREVLPARLAEVTLAYAARCIGTGLAVHAEEAADPDGSARDFEIRVVPTGSGDALAILRDVTARKEAERRISLLATAVEQAAEAIVVMDAAGTIQYVNPAFQNITRYPAQEAVGQSYRLLGSEKESAFHETMWRVLHQGEVWRGRLTNRRRDGTHYDEECTISPVRDTDGTVVSYVAVKRDVTDERLLKRQLQEAQRLEALGTLAGGIAHDFNNLLTPIIGYAEMTLDRVIAEGPERRYLGKILGAAERARQLVKQILAFSRQNETAKAPIALGQLAEEVLGTVRASAPATVAIPTATVIGRDVALADPVQIQQILMNLCRNALHAMSGRAAATLAVRLEAVEVDEEHKPHPKMDPGAYVRVSVSDTGHGMSPEILNRIFEPFFTTKGPGEGTGIGLAAAHGIVRRHGGAITVESEPDRGTRFDVYLPAADPEAEPAAEEAPPVAEGRIPPVEDNADVSRGARVELDCGVGTVTPAGA